MFLGTYEHSLDDKWRITLPARFRGQLEGGAYVAKGRDGCLCVYTGEEWGRVANEIREAARRGPRERQAARSFFAGAAEAVPDRQGRIPLPTALRDFAGLSLDRRVVVAGVYSRVEVWDEQRWRELEAEGAGVIAGSQDVPDFGI